MSSAGQAIAASPSLASRANATLVASALAWLLVTFLETRHLDGLSAWKPLWVAGLIAPVVLLATCLGGLLSWMLEPGLPWGLPRWLQSDERAATRGASVAVLSWAFVVGALIFGASALAALLRPGGATVAAVFGVVVLCTGLLLAPLAVRARELVASRISARTSSLVAASALVVVVLLVYLGDTSGSGGVLRLWGVFRREELHLSLPAYALVALAMGYQLPVWLLRAPRWAGGLVLGMGVGAVAASAGLSTEVAFEVERRTYLAGPSLGVFQRLTDSDGDGFAGAFGGGDCDDGAPEINPEASDIPGNGIDEDCSGRDASDPSKSPATGEEGGPVASAEPNAATAPTAAPTPAAALGKRDDLNVLLITIDTLRYDLGYAGNPRPVSPNIDALAARSTVYDKAYALASYTSKSLGPMLIGRYGSETHRGWMHFNKYPAEDRMVQERLKDAGITTLSVQGHWYFKEDTGLGRGFDVLDMSSAPARPQAEGDKTVNSPQISDAAIKLLSDPERQKQRFFMWVHYLDPHAEYVPHPEFDFGNNGRARYDGEVAFTDFHVGRVLDTLRNSPLSERTIVIVTSDHGEAFNEHGLIRHGFELWEEVVRVPFVVYIPGQPPRRIAQRRSAIDVVPSILDVFGIDAPAGDDALSGESLLPEWYGQAPLPRPIFIDMPAGPYNGDRQAHIVDDMKLITSNSRPMGLYDLARDPGETNNLAKDVTLAEPALERMKEFRSKLRVVKVKPQ